MEKKTNILFIGNCYTWSAIAMLPPIISKMNANYTMSAIYICGARPFDFGNHFDRNLKEPIPALKNEIVKAHNVLYNYNKENGKWDSKKMPDTSIKDVVKETKWDIICVNICNNNHFFCWSFDFFFPHLKYFLNKIREYSSAKVFYIEEPVIADYVKLRHTYSKDYFYGGKFSIINNSEDMFIKVGNIQNECAKILNYMNVPIRANFRILQNSELCNKFRLQYDGKHVDRGIGTYLCNCVLYYSVFYKNLGIKLSDIEFNKNVEKYFYADGITKCISVNNKTKKIVDDIVEKYFNI